MLSFGFLVAPSWGGSQPPQGVPNFHQVDEHVYRGAQPAPQSWKALADLGVKVVLDLRYDNELNEHWIASEQKAVEAAGMQYVSVPMDGWARPKEAQIARALEVLNSGEPVFVHCRAGKDRTGTVVACYRMSHDHWSSQQALAEAATVGMNPLESGMQAFIKDFRGAAAESAATARPAPERRGL